MSIKEVIKQYIVLDDQIKESTKILTALKTEKKALSSQIEDYLTSNSDGNSVLTIGKDIFKLIVYKKTKINKAHIESVLKEHIKNDTTTDVILNEISEDSQESYLKRSTRK